MLQGLTHLAREARPWTFAEARNVLARLLRVRLDTDAERDLAATLIEAARSTRRSPTLPALARPVMFQCGYGASGLPHLGTFGEVARPTMVRSAFRALTDDAIPTRLIVFSDDMDGLRKIPDNVPNRDMLEEDRDKPVTSVRDPFGEHDELRRPQQRPRCAPSSTASASTTNSSPPPTATGRAGSTRCCCACWSGSTPSRRSCCRPWAQERRATYSPFLPISPTTGRVLQVPTLERHLGPRDHRLRRRGRDA